MRMVVDASVVLGWHFSDEQNPYCDSVLTRLKVGHAIMPQIWWFEVRNVLLLGERRGRTQPQLVSQFLKFLSTLRIDLAEGGEDEPIMSLARRHRLTFYDAAYLELAKRERLPLATLDQALAKAASDEGISLIAA